MALLRRRILAEVVIGIVGLLGLAWGGVAAQDNDQTIRVGVVIQGPDGQPQAFCVELKTEAATGLDALRATGEEIVAEEGRMGAAICRVGTTGCTPPGENCFCQCEGGAACAYWAYFHLSAGRNWQYSPVGASSFTLVDGAVEGWWWRDSAAEAAQPLPMMTFEEICQQPAGFPRVVIDGLGREVIIPTPPQRIASVTLGSDEILLSLVGPERLLGVTYLAQDPAISNIADQLAGIPYTDLSGDPERLISLDADLVILAAYNNPAALDQLLAANVPVFVLNDFSSLDDIQANIRLLGQVTGEEERAESLIAEIDARLAEIRQAVSGQEAVRVLYYEPGGITYGPGSTVDEMITLAGGINVVQEYDLGPYPLVDVEFVLAADPDVILLGGWFAEATDPLAAFTRDEAFRTLRAVQAGRVVQVSDAHMTNVSQYFVLGVEDVARALYPAVFDAEMSGE